MLLMSMNLISPETIFSGLYFWRRLCMALSIVLGVVTLVSRESCQKCREKNPDKDALRGFKVIQGHRIWHQLDGHIRLPISY